MNTPGGWDTEERFADDRTSWVEEQLSSLSRGPRDILEFCIEEFDSRYGGTSESSYATNLATHICSDMALMQSEPAIMEKYRRFVIFKATDDETPEGQYGVSLLIV